MLINCPDCQQELSDKAPICLTCGRAMGNPIEPVAQAAAQGRQRSRLRADAGSALGKLSLVAGLVLWLAGWPNAAVIAVFVGLPLGVWLAYGGR